MGGGPASCRCLAAASRCSLLPTWNCGSLQVFGCRKKMSSIAILDYGGANELYARMQQMAQQGRLDFQRQASEMGGLVPQQQPSQVHMSSVRLGRLAGHVHHSCS